MRLFKIYILKKGVMYTALALNEKGIERAMEYSPPLTIESGIPRLFCHMCDVFVRRNTNRSQEQEIERWPQIVAKAQENGIKKSRNSDKCRMGLQIL